VGRNSRLQRGEGKKKGGKKRKIGFNDQQNYCLRYHTGTARKPGGKISCTKGKVQSMSANRSRGCVGEGKKEESRKGGEKIRKTAMTEPSVLHFRSRKKGKREGGKQRLHDVMESTKSERRDATS